MISPGMYLYNIRFGNCYLRCEVLIFDQPYPSYKVSGIVKKIHSHNGFGHIGENKVYNFEVKYLYEIMDPNNAIKEIL
jgi:hypothetical protein